ncbi:Hypothetical protein ABZS17D1_03780 [Kosakonia cowanii]
MASATGALFNACGVNPGPGTTIRGFIYKLTGCKDTLFIEV